MSGLKQCCASGSLHTGTPTGQIKQIHGWETYVAEPPDGNPPTGIILIITDAFGIELPNNRILADAYAKRTGALVYMPDFMSGASMPVEFMISFKALSAKGIMNQLYKFGHFLYVLRYLIPFRYYCNPPTVLPKVREFVKALRNNEAKDLPVGTAGFCWGAYFVTHLCWDETKTDDGKHLVDCGFIAHPSFLKYPVDLEMVVLPLSCAAAEHDMQMSPEDAKQTKAILEAKTEKTREQGVVHEFVMYGGVHHGFAVRADEDEKEEAAAGAKAEDQAVNWFNRWFAKPPP